MISVLMLTLEAVTFLVDLLISRERRLIMLKTAKENSKKVLSELIDNLSETEAYTAKKFVEFLLVESKKRDDKIIEILLNVPEEDEAISEGELKEIEEATSDVKRGNVKSLETYKNERGL